MTVRPARPSFRQPVQEEFTFPKLRFRRSHQDRQGAMEGRAAHFIIPGLGVLQRIGGKVKSSVAKLIYAFRHPPAAQGAAGLR
jgi:hypothetical protein